MYEVEQLFKNGRFSIFVVHKEMDVEQIIQQAKAYKDACVILVNGVVTVRMNITTKEMEGILKKYGEGRGR